MRMGVGCSGKQRETITDHTVIRVVSLAEDDPNSFRTVTTHMTYTYDATMQAIIACMVASYTHT